MAEITASTEPTKAPRVLDLERDSIFVINAFAVNPAMLLLGRDGTDEVVPRPILQTRFLGRLGGFDGSDAVTDHLVFVLPNILVTYIQLLLARGVEVFGSAMFEALSEAMEGDDDDRPGMYL